MPFEGFTWCHTGEPLISGSPLVKVQDAAYTVGLFLVTNIPEANL